MTETAKFAPSEMGEGGGLLDDVDVTFKECRVCSWDYNGKVPTAVPAIKVAMQLADGGDAAEQYWSAGSSKDWMPSEDGKKLVAIGKATALVRSSNAGILMESIINSGFPEDKISDDISALEGMEVHMMRVPAPKRGGLVKTERSDGKDFEATVLTVSKINKLPWEKKSAKGGAKGKGAGKADTVADGDVQSSAEAALMSVLAQHPDGVTKQQIPGLVFKEVDAKDLNRNEVVKLVFTDDFLKAGPWEFADGTVKLG